MSDKDNLHSGHRERMLNKFMNNPDSLLEHELLEALLYYAIPRKDTNLLAHKLIKRFGSLEKVLTTSIAELMAVDGVGEKVACLISLVGMNATMITESKDKRSKIFSLQEIEQELEGFFVEQKFETCVLLLMDKNAYKMIRIEYTDDKIHHVAMNLPDMVRALAVHKPRYAVIAHNHPNGIAYPSHEDDVATKRMKLLCDLQGVALLDHVIYSNGEFFSYHHSDRLKAVGNELDINKILND